MSLTWICESPARWDDDKQRVLSSALESGALSLAVPAMDGLLPGVWWRVEQDGYTVAYGWMDVVWGEAEILLAVTPEAQGIGIGEMVLEMLEAEARCQGLSYLYNVVPASHPAPEQMTGWLEERGFEASADGERLVRRVRGEQRLAA